MENMDFIRSKTVCFTGHRKLRDPLSEVEDKVISLLEDLIQRGYLYFFAGGARGFDALASEAVLKLKEKYPQIHLVLVLPFYEQYKKDNGWKLSEIEQYQNLKERASKVIVLSPKYHSGIYHERNRYLVDNASICIAYMSKIRSGSGYTVNYAITNKLEVVNISDNISPKSHKKTNPL